MFRTILGRSRFLNHDRVYLLTLRIPLLHRLRLIPARTPPWLRSLLVSPSRLLKLLPLPSQRFQVSTARLWNRPESANKAPVTADVQAVQASDPPAASEPVSTSVAATPAAVLTSPAEPTASPLPPAGPPVSSAPLVETGSSPMPVNLEHPAELDATAKPSRPRTVSSADVIPLPPLGSDSAPAMTSTLEKVPVTASAPEHICSTTGFGYCNCRFIFRVGCRPTSSSPCPGGSRNRLWWEGCQAQQRQRYRSSDCCHRWRCLASIALWPGSGDRTQAQYRAIAAGRRGAATLTCQRCRCQSE